MSNLRLHPAPGMGDLMTGWYVVPQNPLQLASEGVVVKKSLGDLLDGCFVVPQNPLRDYTMGMVAPLGQGIAGRPMKPQANGGGMSGLGDCGCGCGGSCGCGGGMGDIGADFSAFTTDLSAGNFMKAFFTDSIGPLPVWVYLAAGIAIFTMARPTGTMRRR